MLTGGTESALPSVVTRACASPLSRDNQCSVPSASPISGWKKLWIA